MVWRMEVKIGIQNLHCVRAVSFSWQQQVGNDNIFGYELGNRCRLIIENVEYSILSNDMTRD